ncbi:MAG: hypothetical protein HQK78_03220 [Desulfobacterales bacterium]|nr:hypothetical protein [Desulfobacterales bacterium]
MDNFLTQREFAKQIGVSEVRISQLVKKGTLKNAIKKEGRTIYIDFEKAINLLSKGLDRSKKTKIIGNIDEKNEILTSEEETKSAANEKKSQVIKSTPMGSLTLHEAMTYQARFKAALLKIELDKKNKKLIDAEEVKIAAFNKGRLVRDAILNVPHRISPILAHKDEAKVFEILDNELRQALEELTK